MPESSPYTEKDTLLLVTKGDIAAFTQLFNEHKNRVYSLAMHLTRSEALAEDIVQEVFARLWEKKALLSEVDYFKSYLRVVVRNVATSYLRRLSLEKLVFFETTEKNEPPGDHLENEIISRQYQEILNEAIYNLTPQQRTAYLLSRDEELSYQQIAEKMNVSVNTVKDHLKKAVRAVRTHVETHIDLVVAVAISLFLKN